MGEEIRQSRFEDADYARYRARLEAETRLLARWFAEGRFADTEPVAGFELEAWLLDEHLRPAPKNAAFLERLDDPMASPELASFNFEVNGTPQPLHGHALSAMHGELVRTWQRCRCTAAELDCRIAMIGILPTAQNEDFTLANMSRLARYRALNREVVRLRRGRPLVLDINGVEHLRVTHRDVMLESAATSFQIHLQLDPQRAVRFYNAAVIASAPMVAVAANSPYLFGKDLWDETRIPVFEQSVAVGGYAGARFGPIRRVTFGSGYVRRSLLELFEENLAHYPVLLPEDFGDDPWLHHLRLHNGTIWRWNRPLVGFDDAGRPHLRLEHRVVPAGPTVCDAMANAAFFYGLMTSLAHEAVAPETRLPFNQARDNFYSAARHGLRAAIRWQDGRTHAMPDLIRDALLPLARAGLERLEVAPDDREELLSVIAERNATGMNGAAWQRAWVARHGRDMTALTAAYLERQERGEPVHCWTL